MIVLGPTLALAVLVTAGVTTSARPWYRGRVANVQATTWRRGSSPRSSPNVRRKATGWCPDERRDEDRAAPRYNDYNDYSRTGTAGRDAAQGWRVYRRTPDTCPWPFPDPPSHPGRMGSTGV